MPEEKKANYKQPLEPNTTNGWKVAYTALFIIFIITAALNMLHIRAGFWTSYAADIVVPALLYISFRGLGPRRRINVLTRCLGNRPEVTALTLFAASALTEVSQFYWPQGIFPGRFDPNDLLAYAGGIGICYTFDKWSSAQTATALDESLPETSVR